MSALLTDPYFEADGRKKEGRKEGQNHHQDINLGLSDRREERRGGECYFWDPAAHLLI